jgi:hypothetical protein
VVFVAGPYLYLRYGLALYRQMLIASAAVLFLKINTALFFQWSKRGNTLLKPQNFVQQPQA